MRFLGRLDDQKLAERFKDYLFGQGIEAQVDPGPEGDWELWVLDDDQVATAEPHWEAFQVNPNDSRFLKGARQGITQQRRERKQNAPKRFRTIDSSRAFYQAPVALGVVTLVLMGLSIALALVTRLGEDDRLIRPLQITEIQIEGNQYSWDPSLPEVRRGQVYRLVTPIFLHFGILHILFNVLWLRDLGSVIESRRGSVQFLLLVLLLAVISNLAQFVHRGPMFGGMSGVVYGLLGYIWMQGKINPAGRLILRPQIVTMMMVWLFLCMTGLMGPIANTAHVVGLLVGMAWGAGTAYWARWRRSF